MEPQHSHADEKASLLQCLHKVHRPNIEQVDMVVAQTVTAKTEVRSCANRLIQHDVDKRVDIIRQDIEGFRQKWSYLDNNPGEG
jgi:hypothetical protein